MDCAIPSSQAETDAGKLLAVVTYKTIYRPTAGKMMTLSFGLGKAILVIAIIGLPTFREWKLVLDVSENRVTLKLLGIYFDIAYQHAVPGFPDGIAFSKADFFRLSRQNVTGKSFATQAAMGNNEIKVVINPNSNECTAIGSDL